jgi:superfamily II DNA or RNA helicase
MRRRFNRSERIALFKMSDGICQGCGKQLDIDGKWHADHVVPFDKDGPTILKNAQLLCPDCNLKKGNKMTALPQWTRKLRPWQASAFAKVTNRFSKPKEGGNNFTLVAFPGSGKTTFSLRVIHDWLMRPGKPFVIVVVPTAMLVKQFYKDSGKLGVRLQHIVKPKKGLKADIHGLVVTYSKIDNNQVWFTELCEQYDVLVVMDECHHLAGENLEGKTLAWGRAALKAFAAAKARLMMTGTAWRSDSHSIPFVEYLPNDKGELTLEADHTYSYINALVDTQAAKTVAEKIVREILFVTMGGESDFYHGEDNHRVKLSPELEKELVSPALRTVLNSKLGEWFIKWFRDADQTLQAIRNDPRNPYPHGAGLVIASSKDRVEEYADLIEKEIGERPTIVHYEKPEATDLIDKFKKNPEEHPRWIIAVNMISEGVDIPRLAVLFYATIVRQRLYFYQAIGRVIRWDKTGPKMQLARVYIPAIEPLNTYAEEIKREIYDMLREPGTGGDGPQLKLFAGIDSEYGLGDVLMTMNDERYEVRWVELAENALAQSQLSGFANSREFGAAMLKTLHNQGDISVAGIVQTPVEVIVTEDWEGDRKKESDALHKAIVGFCYNYFPNDEHISEAIKAATIYMSKDVAGVQSKEQWSDNEMPLIWGELTKWRKVGRPAVKVIETYERFK